jgi:murein DD-endopeptidase MepM/ murein hydrolase activator NlpD
VKEEKLAPRVNAAPKKEEKTKRRSAGYRLPYQRGESYFVSQGRGGVSHKGKMEWALDFAIPSGKSITSIADGQVIKVKNDGQGCGGYNKRNDGNYVVVKHANGLESLYLHLQRSVVNVGDFVGQGQQVGVSGKSGWTNCNAHLHFQLQSSCGSYLCPSVPIDFVDISPAAEKQPLDYNKYKTKIKNV